MEIIFTVTTHLFTFFLVRRVVGNDSAIDGCHIWRWAIVAKDRRDGTTYVYRPDHWRDTDGEEQPFRPYDEFSFVTTNGIDPSRSKGWRKYVAGQEERPRPNEDRHA